MEDGKLKDENREDGRWETEGTATFSALDMSKPLTGHLPPLPRAFYLQDTLDVAKYLLNCLLVHDSSDGLTVGRISETEAYTRDDPACHAFTRKSERNAAMFGPPGHAYMHLNYGLHWCFNAVTAPEHIAEAALVRAIEPLIGVELMRRRRGLPEEEPVAAETDPAYFAKMRAKTGIFLGGGPGKLTVAMGIGKAFNNLDLTTGQKLWIAPPTADTGYAEPENIIATTRIGISKAAERPWRFYLRHDPYISKK